MNDFVNKRKNIKNKKIKKDNTILNNKNKESEKKCLHLSKKVRSIRHAKSISILLNAQKYLIERSLKYQFSFYEEKEEEMPFETEKQEFFFDYKKEKGERKELSEKEINKRKKTIKRREKAKKSRIRGLAYIEKFISCLKNYMSIEFSKKAKYTKNKKFTFDNFKVLQFFLTDHAEMKSGLINHLSVIQQRKITKSIKKLRYFGLLPFSLTATVDKTSKEQWTHKLLSKERHWFKPNHLSDTLNKLKLFEK
jgi:ribosomal protein S18